VFQPTTFGNYFLTRRLAVGGMAEVYAAKLYGADGFEKDIVIKQILPQYARDPEFVQSFVAEAKIAVTLSHANVVGIYELGRVDGTYFIAMEYVDGLDVFTMIDTAKRANEAISPGTALYITEEVAKGLDYAHRKVGPDAMPLGLVHRDLSPRNVLVSKEGEVKILDFGIAKTRSDYAAAMPKTRAGVVKGTSGYMSPEQAVGDEVDARTDVYQAGLLLFELLTGRALFWRPDDEETRDLMRKHEVIPPSRLSPEVPIEIDRIVLSALARDRSQRIQSAHELGAMLARLRVALYPEANGRSLSEQASRLFAIEQAQNEEAERALPSTNELARTLGVLRTQEPRGRIETIATRTPASGEEALPLPVPHAQEIMPPSMLGSSEDASALVEKVSSIPRGSSATSPVPSRDILSLGHEIAPKPAANSRRLAAVGALLAVGAVAIIAATALPTDATTKKGELVAIEPAKDPPPRIAAFEDNEALEAIEPTPVADPPTTPNPPPETQPQLAKATPSPSKDPPSKRIVHDAAAGAVVAFGTKSCSSRVSVDGAIVTRSTPFYDYKLSAGHHRIMIEGTNCPPVERPGSLRASIPTVVKDVEIDPGSSVKIIADFERDRLLVKK
jgi:serine/threonine protein kinase